MIYMAGEILRKMSKVVHLYSDNGHHVCSHYHSLVTRWFHSENLSNLIDLPVGSLNISVCWVTSFGKTHTECDTTIYCIYWKSNFRLTSSYNLTFIPVSYEYTKISYIIEINNRGKQFSRLGNWKPATRLPAKFGLMLPSPCLSSQKQILISYIRCQEF